VEKHTIYKENPFLDKLRIKEGIKISKIANVEHFKLIDTNNNKIDKDSKVVYAKEVSFDKTGFTKVFNNDLMFLNDLSKTGLKLFTYLLKYKLEYNRDTIIVNINEAIEKLNYKQSAKKEFNKAITELIELDIFARSTESNIFYLNPAIFYRGERRYLLYDKPKID